MDAIDDFPNLLGFVMHTQHLSEFNNLLNSLIISDLSTK